MSYAEYGDLYRAYGYLRGQDIEGVKPADLPVQQATKFAPSLQS